MIDTGFNGHLALPPDVIARLKLPVSGVAPVRFADGSEGDVDEFVATLLWDGTRRQAPVMALEFDPLIGMKLLAGQRLTIEVLDGGAVTVEAL